MKKVVVKENKNLESGDNFMFNRSANVKLSEAETKI